MATATFAAEYVLTLSHLKPYCEDAFCVLHEVDHSQFIAVYMSHVHKHLFIRDSYSLQGFES